MQIQGKFGNYNVSHVTEILGYSVIVIQSIPRWWQFKKVLWTEFWNNKGQMGSSYFMDKLSETELRYAYTKAVENYEKSQKNG